MTEVTRSLLRPTGLWIQTLSLLLPDKSVVTIYTAGAAAHHTISSLSLRDDTFRSAIPLSLQFKLMGSTALEKKPGIFRKTVCEDVVLGILVA